MNHPQCTSSRWRTSWKADPATRRGQQELYISDYRGGYSNLSYEVLRRTTPKDLENYFKPDPPLTNGDLSELRHLIADWMFEVRYAFPLVGFLRSRERWKAPFLAPKSSLLRWWLPKPKPTLQPCPTCSGTGHEPEAWGRGWAEGERVLLAKGGPCEDCLVTGYIAMEAHQY